MSKITTLISALAFGLLSTMPAQAEPQKFELDKAHADATFRILHLGYSYTHGRFHEIDGDLTLDLDNLPNSSVAITIQTASIDTAFQKRDTHLKSADFFNVAAMPTMTFKSTSIEGDDKSAMKVTGDLTIMGQARPITLDVKVNRVAPHPRSKKMTVGATATGTLKRSQWGMGFGVPNIGDEVEIRFDLEASAAE